MHVYESIGAIPSLSHYESLKKNAAEAVALEKQRLRRVQLQLDAELADTLARNQRASKDVRLRTSKPMKETPAERAAAAVLQAAQTAQAAAHAASREAMAELPGPGLLITAPDSAREA